MTVAALGVRELISRIEASPDGPEIGAFFDLDGTLVEGYTAGPFYADRLRRGDVSPKEFAQILLASLDGTLGGDPSKVGGIVADGLCGQSEDLLVELGERLFVQKIAGTMRPQARAIVAAHLRKGHTVAVASSATRYQIAPVARDLGIGHILCTELVAEDGVLTGELAGPMLWGEPKAAAVRAFARERDVDLPASFAYANGAEDVAFLSSVGTPHALNPHPGLASAAQLHGWPVVLLRAPHKTGVRAAAGTAAAMVGLNVGVGLGAAVGLLNRDKRFGVNAGMAIGSDLALALAGVKVDVLGEENLWRGRPCVFVANHQSGLDVIVLASLLRRDFTGVAKLEARYDPRGALVGALLDPAFIDRSDPESAQRDVNALVDRIRAGTSVAIMPEGTRTPTSTVQRFKKGGFHLAMQAGVPMVPIVLRNAGELNWRRSPIIHPGTVEVAVLDPVPTTDWTPDNLDDQVAHVRNLFVSTLDRWPGGA
ncbi:HAD-IB family hydrolase [Nocardioides limicola]|uniref:HAD-IB family hydrolase n=1 Tax=Nocardioides limicola TaxID=2803368 RepID=UPI00193B3462|nr:HAD-IB family hydrolase [Nocardioides sp. DJM-14]